MATLSYHTNQSFWATAKKNTKFVEANTKNISVKSQPYVPYGFWGNILPFFCILVAMATIKIRTGQQNNLPGRGPFKEHFYKFCQNICDGLTINAIFLFSHYKSVATLSCHTNQSFWAIAMKNTTFVEANTKNISAKSQPYVPYGFWGDDL